MKVISISGASDDQALLTRHLYEASVSYYSGHPVMSDFQFDTEREMLTELEEANGFAYNISPNVIVGAQVVSSLQKSEHEEPALSLDKVKYVERKKLLTWLGAREGVLSWKMDGLTVVATYDNGRLTKAVTRGDGYVGSDITHNAVYFHGLPINIPYAGHLVVRGECTMSNEEFERVGEGYENARNLASATIQLLDSRESSKRKIDFTAFELVTPVDKKEMSGRFEWLKVLGFRVVQYKIVTAETILSAVEELRNVVATNPFPTDGLVLTFNDQYYAASLGNTGHHPRGSIAMKWTDETVPTYVTDIEWSVGKTGVITPVAIFDTVRLGLGSNVSRASLHNLSIMERLGVGVGSKVEVYLANCIIPQLASATKGEVKIPDKCPVCGQQLSIVENNGVKNLVCGNPDCAAKKVKQMATFVSKEGMNIDGLSEAKVGFLLSHGFIRRPSDLYRVIYSGLAMKKLASFDGWGTRSVKNMIAAIEKSKDTDLQHFLCALSIPLVGKDMSKKLAKYFGTIENFISFAGNPDKRISAEDGIGDVKAQSLYDWCKDCDLDDLEWLASQLRFSNSADEPTGRDLTGLTFVITGAVHHFKNRDEFKRFVEARDGKVAGSVSGKTSYLVNNDSTSESSKNRKAKELGVEIITEDEFVRRFADE